MSSFARLSSTVFVTMSLAFATDCHSNTSTARLDWSNRTYCIDSKSSVCSLTPPAGPWLSPFEALLCRRYPVRRAPCRGRGPSRGRWQRPSWSRPPCTTCDSAACCTCRQQRHNQPVQNYASSNKSNDLEPYHSTLIVHMFEFSSNFPSHYPRLFQAILRVAYSVHRNKILFQNFHCEWITSDRHSYISSTGVITVDKLYFHDDQVNSIIEILRRSVMRLMLKDFVDLKKGYSEEDSGKAIYIPKPLL